MSVLLTAVATLGAIGAGSATILYGWTAVKVEEDPRIQEVQDAYLPPTAEDVVFPDALHSLQPA